jgi:3-hydroxybutyryl-CoA dehydrogenase
MTIAAITEKYTKEHLAGFFPGKDIEWVLLREVETTPGAEVYFDLDFAPDRSRCEALNRLLPALIIVNAVTPTIGEIGYPFVRINAWPGFLERSIHELAVPDEEAARKIAKLYEKLGRDHRIVADIPGLISARILATIINEAWFTWEEKVSTKEEIDTAMKLGTNYPLGPFEWGQRIGLGQIARLLWSLGKTAPEYTPAEALLLAADGLKYD